MKTTKPETVPTLTSVLETMAFHLRELATEVPSKTAPAFAKERVHTGFGLGGYAGMPAASVSVEIRPCVGYDGDPWGPWAQVTMREGFAHFENEKERESRILYQGNRCGAGDALARHYAPVIAWVAVHQGETVAPAVKKASMPAPLVLVASEGVAV